jgi:hypothetical protein
MNVADRATMKTQLPMATKEPVARDGEHIVLEFRPRNPLKPLLPSQNLNARDFDRPDLNRQDLSRHSSSRQGSNREGSGRRDFERASLGIPRNLSENVASDLSRYERDREAPDDFQHRMLANTAAFALTVALLAIGIWLAMSIADMRDTQDCVLMGRRDCAHIASPPA